MTLNAPNQSSLNHSPFPILEHPSMHLAADVPLFLHHKLLQCPLLLLYNAEVVLASSFRPTFYLLRRLFTPHQASSSLKGERGNWKLAHVTHTVSYRRGVWNHTGGTRRRRRRSKKSSSLSLLACARVERAFERPPAPVRRRPSTFFGSFAPSIHPSLLRSSA